MKKALTYIVPILAGFVVGFLSQQVQADAIENWYPLLNKPALTPPNWMFPVAWNIIYIVSGISIGLIWNSATPRRRQLICLWVTQLVLNFTWCLLFFYFRNPLAGLINIVILDIIVVWYAVRAYPVNRASAWLFAPYMLWLLLATYLNLYILINN